MTLLLLAGCGGGNSNADDLVWCVAPGEKVTPAFKAEYPELQMPRIACDAVETAGG